jgi:hypothetical protein
MVKKVRDFNPNLPYAFVTILLSHLHYHKPLTTGEDFSLAHKFQATSGAHTASYPLGIYVPSSGVKRTGREANHSPPSIAKVKNAWRYAATPPHVLMVRCTLDKEAWKWRQQASPKRQWTSIRLQGATSQTTATFIPVRKVWNGTAVSFIRTKLTHLHRFYYSIQCLAFIYL